MKLHSQKLAEFIASIAPQWAARGLRIICIYHEAQVTGVFLIEHGRLAGYMNNWLEFTHVNGLHTTIQRISDTTLASAV